MKEIIDLIKQHPAETIASALSIISLAIAILSLRETRISAFDKIKPFVFPIIGPISTYVKKDRDNKIFLLDFKDEELSKSLGFHKLKVVCLNSHAFEYKYTWHYDTNEYIKLLEEYYTVDYSIANKDVIVFENFPIDEEIFEFVALDSGRSKKKSNKSTKHYLKVNEENYCLHFPEFILEIITFIHFKLEGRTNKVYPPIYLKQEFSDVRGTKYEVVFKVVLRDFNPMLFPQEMDEYKCLTTIFSDVQKVKSVPRKLRNNP